LILFEKGGFHHRTHRNFKTYFLSVFSVAKKSKSQIGMMKGNE